MTSFLKIDDDIWVNPEEVQAVETARSVCWVYLKNGKVLSANTTADEVMKKCKQFFRGYP